MSWKTANQVWDLDDDSQVGIPWVPPKRLGKGRKPLLPFETHKSYSENLYHVSPIRGCGKEGVIQWGFLENWGRQHTNMNLGSQKPEPLSFSFPSSYCLSLCPYPLGPSRKRMPTNMSMRGSKPMSMGIILKPLMLSTKRSKLSPTMPRPTQIEG